MLSLMRPFGCLVTILNTIDHLGKFDRKADEGFFVGYSLTSKAFRVFNSKTRIVEETLHIRFSENTHNNMGSGLNWLFDIDALTKTINYWPVVTCTQSNGNVGIKDNNNAGQARKEKELGKDYILLPLWTADPPFLQEPKSSQDAGFKPSNNVEKKTLMDLPYGKRAIGTKWVFKNKNDEIGIVIRNKARLVAQGHTQEEGIDYDEVFALVSRIEAIWLFLAYASFKDFVVYQMDVKSDFIYRKIKEEVYVCQPLGFEDLEFLDKVYKVKNALYGLYQALRAWYETLLTYLLDNGFQREKIDKTLFIRRHKGDILLVQVCIDDIIFGSTKKELCNAFENMMHEKFQMSSMGELTFFKYGFLEVKNASTPMETQKPLLKDKDGEEVDVHMYRLMIGLLMYLISLKPDIMFAVCACARY
nr:retrovirus-related Pol polyprotein from transposon TNT 1-94 [Tanacetum cinerariifolium]